MTATKTMLKVARGIPAVLLRESTAPTRTVLVPGDYEVLGRSDDKRYVSLCRGADKWTVQAAQLQEAAASPKPAKGDVTWTPHRTLGEARRALRRIESARSLQEAQAFARSYLEGETPDEPNPDEKPSGEPDAGFEFGSDEPAPAGEEPPIDLGAGLDAPAGGAAEPTVVSKADWDSKLKAGQAAYMGGTPFVVLQDETTSITALVPVEIGDKSDPAIKDTKAAGGGESKAKDKDEKKADD
ncbi:MAG: hypothetical protein IPH13_20470 [Planctomycetes bacterium]|nr:hypothetical protein [Planctomycetota bacterium]